MVAPPINIWQNNELGFTVLFMAEDWKVSNAPGWTGPWFVMIRFGFARVAYEQKKPNSK